MRAGTPDLGVAGQMVVVQFFLFLSMWLPLFLANAIAWNRKEESWRPLTRVVATLIFSWIYYLAIHDALSHWAAAAFVSPVTLLLMMLLRVWRESTPGEDAEQNSDL